MPSRKEVYDYSYDGAMRSLEASLERLGVDRVDILFAHDLDVFNHGTPEALAARIDEFMAGGYRALVKLRDEGVIKAFGAGVNEWQPCKTMTERGDFDIFLLAGRYTLLEQEALTAWLPQAVERGIGVVMGGPYNSGILATGPKPGAFWFYDLAPQEVLDRAARIQAICQRARGAAGRCGLPVHAAPSGGGLGHSRRAEGGRDRQQRGGGAGDGAGCAVGGAEGGGADASRRAGGARGMIDAHQHFWNPARGDYGWMPKDDPVLSRVWGPGDLAPHLARHGIEKTVLVQAAPSIAETEYMLGIADATPFVAGVVGWVDFERPADRANCGGWRGIRPSRACAR